MVKRGGRSAQVETRLETEGLGLTCSLGLVVWRGASGAAHVSCLVDAMVAPDSLLGLPGMTHAWTCALYKRYGQGRFKHNRYPSKGKWTVP